MQMRSRNPAMIGEVIRRQGGAIEVNFKDDVKVEEMAAIMLAITNTAKEMGWPPGKLFGAYYQLEQRQNAAARGEVIMPPGWQNGR